MTDPAFQPTIEMVNAACSAHCEPGSLCSDRFDALLELQSMWPLVLEELRDVILEHGNYGGPQTTADFLCGEPVTS